MDNPILDIYYDNKNDASDVYLKYLIKDCEENGITVRVFNNKIDWLNTNSGDGELFLEPCFVDKALKDTDTNVDKDSATATGIYNYITENYPDRDKIIMVIGRGLVGKQLIDKLINYGYTIIEVNSQTNKNQIYTMAYYNADIIIGLAETKTPIFGEGFCSNLTKKDIKLIDAANNFATKEKLRCGKWTRRVIINRVFQNYKKKRG